MSWKSARQAARTSSRLWESNKIVGSDWIDQLVRIDDRLIHGQVVTQWVSRVKANRIIVVDDAVAKDTLMTTVCKSLAPSGTVVEVYPVEAAIPKMIEYGSNDELRVIILTKIPQPLLTLHEGGVAIEKIVVGGMGIKPGRTKLFRNIAADEDERATFKKLIDAGIAVNCQIVPDDVTVEVKGLCKIHAKGVRHIGKDEGGCRDGSP